MTLLDEETKALWVSLYEKHGKPLEATHDGQFLAVSRDGRTVVGPDEMDVAQRAADELGRGIYLYKIGTRAIGRFR